MCGSALGVCPSPWKIHGLSRQSTIYSELKDKKKKNNSQKSIRLILLHVGIPEMLVTSYIT